MGEADQSKVLDRTMTEIANRHENVSNYGAWLGANLANSMIANGVGIAAFIIVIWCSVIALRLIRGVKVFFFTFTFISLINLIACSMIVGAFTQNLE